MRIESIILRQGGSRVSLPNADGSTTTYHFHGPVTGPHLCEVEDEDHIGMLLRVSEGFRVPRKAAAAPQSEPPRGPAPEEEPGEVDEGDDDDDFDPDASPGDMTEPEARSAYLVKFGRPAPPKTKLSTLIAKLKEE